MIRTEARAILKTELYRWQSECLTEWERNRFRGIVSAVTGAGKTCLALEAIRLLRERNPQLRVKVVVPTLPLAQQWQTVLFHAAKTEAERPGFFGGEKRDDPKRSVMIYILNSARTSLSAHMRREFALGHPCLLICDECHHVQSPQNRHIFDFLTPGTETGSLYACLGLSATPFGTEHDEILTRCLGREIYRYDLNAAGAEGVVAPFLLCEVSVPFLPEERESYNALTDALRKARNALLRAHPELTGLRERDFLRRVSALARQAEMAPEEPAAAFLLKAWQRKRLSNLAQGRLRCALALLETLECGGRVLVFCERTEQAERFAWMVRRRFGAVCGVYHSGMTKEARNRVLYEFRERRTRVLVSCRCLDEGIDVPDANVGIVLSSSAAERQRIQRLGRIIRSAPGKDAARLYYLYVRDAAEDSAYLAGIPDTRVFQLRYELPDGAFSSELYEYAALSLLRRARERGCTEPQLRELRACLTEGLPRGDYLLPPQLLERRRQTAQTRHVRNYWSTIQSVRDILCCSKET